VIRSQFGCNKPSLLSDDFLFIFPVVGPLSKEDFIEVAMLLNVVFSLPPTNAGFLSLHTIVGIGIGNGGRLYRTLCG
jgi:hypothetical protein